MYRITYIIKSEVLNYKREKHILIFVPCYYHYYVWSVTWRWYRFSQKNFSTCQKTFTLQNNFLKELNKFMCGTYSRQISVTESIGCQKITYVNFVYNPLFIFLYFFENEEHYFKDIFFNKNNYLCFNFTII